MSTLLATTNPAAAAEFQNRDLRRPYEGQSVIFHARPGEGRGGRTTAVGLVLRVEDDDNVDIIIIHDADDFIVRNKIPRKTDQNNVNCWSFNDYDERNYDPVASSMNAVPGDALSVTVDGLVKELEAQKQIIQKLDRALAKRK